jgi:cytochrome c oxidase assembly protein subunit 15
MSAPTDIPVPPRWLHGWAILTVCAALPLLFLGAEVTTKGVGMVDPVGYWSPLQLVNKLLADEYGSTGLRIEYSHRMAGFTVGICTIVLALGLWLSERRRWVQWFGTAVLALVCIQGLLGIFRVNLDALFHRNLALIHGLFAQIVIAAMVSLAVVLSRGWVRDRADFTAVAPELRRWTLLTALLIFGQIIFGALIRHSDYLLASRGMMLGPRMHLLGAFIVLAAVLRLTVLVRQSEQRDSFRGSLRMLHILVGVQLLLGIETWLGKFFLPLIDRAAADSAHVHWTRSAHYVVGALLFATSVVMALQANRRTSLAHAPQPARHLEGVA